MLRFWVKMSYRIKYEPLEPENQPTIEEDIEYVDEKFDKDELVIFYVDILNILRDYSAGLITERKLTKFIDSVIPEWLYQIG